MRTSANTNEKVALRAMLTAVQQGGNEVAQLPKRIPGERNPRGDVDAPMHVAREGQMANGLGSGDLGIGRAVSAMFDWWNRGEARRRH